MHRSLATPLAHLASDIEPWAMNSLSESEGVTWTLASEGDLSGWPVMIDSIHSVVRFQVDGDVFLEYHKNAASIDFASGIEIDGVGMVFPSKRKLVRRLWWLVQYDLESETEP